MGIKRKLAVALVALAAFPAVAQDGSEGAVQRTPENAQRFLNEFIGQGGFVAVTNFRLAGSAGYRPYRETETGDFASTSGRVAGWTATDRCRSRVDLADVRTIYSGPSHGYPAQPMSLEIDWQKVTTTSVAKEAANYNLRMSDAPGAPLRSVWWVVMGVRLGDAHLPVLLFDTKEEADRVGFAIDFLRKECELKSDTGF